MEKNGGVPSLVGILYFSGTGNTAWVAHEMERLVLEQGLQCRTLASDQLLAECGQGPGTVLNQAAAVCALDDFINGLDLLVLCFPVHDSNVPRPLKDLFQWFPKQDGLPLAVVATLFRAGGDAVAIPGKLLKGKGYRPVLTGYVKMPNNIRLPHMELFPIKNGKDLEPYVQGARASAKALAGHLLAGPKKKGGLHHGGHIMGTAQRWAEHLVEPWFLRHLFATANCIRCRLCASTCPMGNIRFDKGYPEFGTDCCLCMRCYSFCPKEAIQFTDKTRDREEFPRYKGLGGYKPPRLREIPKKAKKRE